MGGAALVGYLGHRYLRIVPLVGFLLTGVLLGPYALGAVRDLQSSMRTAPSHCATT